MSDRREIADLAGKASNTIGELQDFLLVATLALLGDMTDTKAEQASAFATVLTHCSKLANEAREHAGLASDKAMGTAA